MALTYLRAVGPALAEGFVTAAWVAAAELPARRRRLVRAGTVASVFTVGVLRAARDPNRAAARDPNRAAAHDPARDAAHGLAQTGTPESADGRPTKSAQPAPIPTPADAPTPTPADATPVDARKVAVTLVLGVVSIGTTIGRRRLEKRWLARLEANGHEHPHRALAVRMGLLSAAVTLPGRLYAAHNSVDLERGRGSSVVR
jgi:hypothetical protein